MRELTDREKQLVTKLVNDKQAGNIDELQPALILRKQLSIMALKWSVEQPMSLTIYYDGNGDEEEKKRKQQEALQAYFEICDYVYFVKELVENKMLILQLMSFEDNKPTKVLYNKKIYQYDEEKDCFLNNSYNNLNEELKSLLPEDFSKMNWSYHNLKLDIVSMLNEYLSGTIVYPLPLLEDFVNHDFKTIEQRQFEAQINNANSNHREQLDEMKRANSEQISKTNWSLFVASLAVLIPALIDLFYDKPVELSDKQLLQIERSIINSKIVLPDTLNVKSSISLFPHYKDSINLIIHKLPKNKMDSRKVSGQTT